MRPFILVCGCHRSGTSALAKMLIELGIDLGNKFYGGNDDPSENPAGFWEHIPLSMINRRLLKQSASYPGDVMRHIWEQHKTEAVNILNRDSKIDGFKDPRTTIMLPFWTEVAREARGSSCVIKMYRSPAEVASSMLQRGDLDWGKGVRIAHQYEDRFIQDILRCRVPHMTMSHTVLMENPYMAALELTEFLHLRANYELPEPEVVERASKVVDKALHRHHTVEDAHWWKVVN